MTLNQQAQQKEEKKHRKEEEEEEKSMPKTVKTKNPATEEVLNEYDILTKEQINEAAKKAKDAFIQWSTIGLDKRTGFLYDFASELRKNKELSRFGMLEFVNIKSVRFYDELSHQHHVE